MKDLHRESYLWSLCCCHYDEDLAKDVLQTAYLKVLEKKAEFAGKSQRKTWFFSIIKFTAIDAFRKRNIRTLPLVSARSLAEELPEDRPDDNRQAVQKILDRLSDQQREVLTLVFYNDLTIEEAAEVLNISTGAARSHYSRGKENFKKWMEKTKKKQG